MTTILEDATQYVLDGSILTEARLKKGDVEIVEGTRGGISFKTTTIPIDYYFKRSIISPMEYGAANRFFKDFYHAGMANHSGVNMDAVRSANAGSFLPRSESQRDALTRWRDAVSAVHGAIGKKMIVNVCCYGYWLKDGLPKKKSELTGWDYAYYNDAAAAMSRFHEALSDLTRHYDGLRKNLS